MGIPANGFKVSCMISTVSGEGIKTSSVWWNIPKLRHGSLPYSAAAYEQLCTKICFDIVGVCWRIKNDICFHIGTLYK
jgi:hypothetical protein